MNGKGNGALIDMDNPSDTTGYLQVAEYGKFGSNMGLSPTYKAIAPRIGAAYQLNPKTVIRAGYGRSFDLGVFGSIFGHVGDAEPADSDQPVALLSRAVRTPPSAFTLAQWSGPALR